MLKSIITIALCGLALAAAFEYVLRAIEPEELKRARRKK